LYHTQIQNLFALGYISQAQISYKEKYVVKRATLSIPQIEELGVNGTTIIFNLNFDHTFYGFIKQENSFKKLSIKKENKK